ncbi:MAG: glycosyltransferase family 2 protein, partial [Actinomycetota bacterium]
DPSRFEEPAQVFALSGGACLIRREALDRVGPFDPKYFMYFEDVDWSFRASLVGYRIGYQPLAIVRHLVGASAGSGFTPFVRFHTIKNFWLLYLKNMPTLLLWRHLPKFLLFQAFMLASSVRNGVALPHLKGLGWVVVRLPGLLLWRRAVQRDRRVDNSALSIMITQHLPPQYRRRFKGN